MTAQQTQNPDVTSLAVAGLHEAGADTLDRRSRSRRWWAGGVLVVVLAAVGGLVASGASSTQRPEASEAGARLAAVTETLPATAQIGTRRTSGVCGFDTQVRFIARLLERRGIPLPVIESTPGIAHAAQYLVGGRIQIRDRCVSGSVLAHETGHYVHLLVTGSFDAALADAEANFAGSWMRNGQYPGLERAAHCVGNVLWGHGPYTRCPVRASWLHANHLVWYGGNPGS